MTSGFGLIVAAYAKAAWSFAKEAFWIFGFPFLLAAQVVVPVYLVDIRLAMSLLSLSDQSDNAWVMYFTTEDSGAALGTTITVIVLSVFFLSLWIIPLAYCLWSHYWVAANWRPVSAPEAPIKQVEGESRKRRYCDRCGIFQGDRTYHCRQLDKCLPMFDHTCYWWTGAVWLHNMGAYLLFILFLPVYQLFLLGVSLWVTFSPKHYWKYNAYISIGIPAGLMLFLSGGVLWQFGKQLVVWNVLEKEMCKGVWFLNEEGEVRFWHPENAHPSTNPWNNGWFWNLLAIFSHRLKDTTECTSQGETAISLRPLGMTNRRAFGASTGFGEDSEPGNLVRRTHSSA